VEQHRSLVPLKQPYRILSDHVRLAVRLTPNSGRDAIEGVEGTADGESHFRARVTAVPEKGKANEALVKLLAKSIGLPKSSVSIVSGDTARLKILRIDGDPEDIVDKLQRLVAG